MRKGLTIGELLITMTLIGVIATLVLPGFMKDYHKRIYTTRIKKVYEMVEYAVNQACADSNVTYFIQTPYARAGNEQTFINKYFKRVSAQTSNMFASTYTSINGSNSITAPTSSMTGKAKLAGGESIGLKCGEVTDGKNNCIFYVDINATDGPNIGGRDFIYFRINSDNNQLFETTPVAYCTTVANGAGCFNKLLEDAWEMKY